MRKHLPTLGLLLQSSLLFAQSNSSAIIKLKEIIGEWVAGIVTVGMLGSAGILMMGYASKIKFFEHLAEEHKQKFFWTIGICLLCRIFSAEIAGILATMVNPLGIK